MVKILVVEDERIVAEDIRDSLGRLGYDVPAVVGSGKEAVAAAQETQPDLVLMDIVLKGGIDGIEAAKQIQARFNLPVVFLTAHADGGTLQRAKVTEPLGYLLKPFDERELSIAIEMALYKHRAEKTLREAEEAYRTLVERSLQGIAIFQDRRFVFANQAIAGMTGYTVKELLALPAEEIPALTHPEDRERVATYHRNRLIGEPAPERYEQRIVCKDGTICWVDAAATAIEYRGRPASQVFYVDITERKQAEAAMIRASRLEATATLAGGVAHKVNNLMSGVLGYAELLKLDLPQDSEMQEMLDTISRSAEQTSELATQMLAFAQSGRHRSQIVNLSDTVQGVLLTQELDSRPGIRVELDTDPDTWSILADRVQMGQVFFNLFTNAVEAIEGSGQITIATRNATVDKPTLTLESGPYVCLSVKDTGCGMSAEVQGRIFEPFFTTKFQGRGLGLAAVYGIVRNHGGDIVVHSEEGQGATFKVYVPAVP